jgi:hypothetical protein
LNRVYTEEVISMTMRRIDGGQILSTCDYPFGKRPVLLHGDECVYQTRHLVHPISGVDDIGDHLLSVAPGGKSLVMTAT